MDYKIFISHTNNDRRLAEGIKQIINNAFQGTIHLYLAIHEIDGGAEWKKEIKENLERCDAVISVITRHSVQKPWILIEWAAFWLQDKKFYTLISDEIKVSEIINPMTDRQVTTLTDVDSVKRFFRNLSRDANYGTVPYQYVEEFVEAVRIAIKLQDQEFAEQSYAKYRTSLVDLPRNDAEKRKIADFFYESGELNVFNSVVNEIRDDLVKYEIAAQMIVEGDLDTATRIVRNIRAADKLNSVARTLIDYGYINVRILHEIIEDIASKNQAELRSLAIHTIALGLEDSDLFESIIGSFGSMAELRKVVIHLVENNKLTSDSFDDLIEHFTTTNRAELRKVAEFLIESGQEETLQFKKILLILAAHNQKETEKVLTTLFRTNPQHARRLINEKLITNRQSLERLNKLMSETNNN